MNAGAKLSAYGLVLAAALGGGAALGGAAGPIDVDGAPTHEQHDDDSTESGLGSDEPSSPDPATGGLSVSTDGYRFVVEDALADPGEFAFVIEGADGQAVTGFDIEHEMRLHLVIASRDLRDYTHLHPEMDTNGRWTAILPTLPAGAYRAFADFRPLGRDAITLGIDLTNPGAVAAPEPPSPKSLDVVDDYEVHLEGAPVAGRTTAVELAVHLDGESVTTEPYLGASGHLVALRHGDLGYLHVHPLPDEGDGTVRFAVEVPSPGAYALFFDFSHDGTVRTAQFVIEVPPDDATDGTTEYPTDEPVPDPAGDGPHDH